MALTVIALGVLLVLQPRHVGGRVLVLFALVGLLHGYALWANRSIGAEQTPLYAYLIGLAVIQIAIALAAMYADPVSLARSRGSLALRLVGAAIAGIGLAILVQQVVPARLISAARFRKPVRSSVT